MSTRFRLFLITFGALIVAATFTFPQWQHLLTPQDQGETVEVLSGLAPELRPTFEALPAEQQGAYRQAASVNPAVGLAMVNAALQPPIEVPEVEQALPSMSGPIEVAVGEFTRLDAIRWALGDVVVYQQADNSKVLRFESFSVVNGPNLHVILSGRTADTLLQGTPLPGELAGNDVDLGALKGTLGAQNYDVPPELDISSYNSVLIVSQSLNIIYSIAPLFAA